MIWFVFAALTAAAAMSVLLPLARARGAAGVARSEADVAFYESEVASIGRDLERGIIDEKEAEGARAEAARRLLAAAPAAGKDAQGGAARRAAAIFAISVVAVAGVGLYAVIGLPAYPDQPLVARQSAPPDQMDIMAAVAKIEAHLAKNPGDARGYEVIAPVYMRIGRFADAAKAWGETIRLSGPTPERFTLMGESLIFANDGKAGPEAVKAFEAALAIDPAFPQARFYLGLAAEQGGDRAKAIELWSKLLADAEPGAPWASVVRERLEGLGVREPPAAQGVPQGPAAAAIAAMPAADRNAAIRGMVDSLAERLANDGNDPAGWLRLVRAYTVLKEPEKAKAALTDARRALAADPAALKGLDELARELGLEG
ncbi:MAG: c-type cytochrome biogenesis protein CcmI [Beijerinckiaceae bacterium]